MIKSGIATVASSMNEVIAKSQILERVLVYDTFTDANGTDLTAHTPDINIPGNAWQNVIDSGYKIESNTAEPYSGNNPTAVIESGVSNVEINDVLVPSIFNLRRRGPMLRYSDVSNYWIIAIFGFNTCEIQEVVGGTPTTRASDSFTYISTDTVTINVVASDTTITAIFTNTTTPDTATISYSLATHNQTETIHGITGARGGGRDRHDSFEVIG